MKFKLYIVIILSVLTQKVFSTPQVSDLIIIENDTLPLYSLPLENYLENQGISNDIFGQFGFSTACWRNYRAIWEIENDSLFLQDLVSCISDTVKIPFKLIFKNAENKKSLFAYWVTDTLWAEIGNAIYYLHEGWGYFYDKEKSYILNNGIINSTKVFDYTNKIFITEMNNDILPLSKIYCDKINWNNIEVPVNEIKIFVIQNNDTNYIAKIIGKADKSYEKEALRIVKELKPTKLFQHNKEIKLSYNIPIIFSKETKENCEK